jgi:hypothetical protein
MSGWRTANSDAVELASDAAAAGTSAWLLLRVVGSSVASRCESSLVVW